MKSTLEDLWFSYQLEYSVERQEEEREILRTLVANEETLHAGLTEQQKEQLKIFENSLNQLHSLTEKQAFIKGVRFTTRFLLEALHDT